VRSILSQARLVWLVPTASLSTSVPLPMVEPSRAMVSSLSLSLVRSQMTCVGPHAAEHACHPLHLKLLARRSFLAPPHAALINSGDHEGVQLVAAIVMRRAICYPGTFGYPLTQRSALRMTLAAQLNALYLTHQVQYHPGASLSSAEPQLNA
jgi:hypothetical protein